MICFTHASGFVGVWAYVSPDITVGRLSEIEHAIYLNSLSKWRRVFIERLGEDA